MASFRHIKEGDLVYELVTYGRGKNRRQWISTHKVVGVHERSSIARGGLFKTLPCYPDGEVYLYFGMYFRRSSGIEYADSNFEQPTDRPRVRLLLTPPEGIPFHERPEPQKLARAA